MTARDFLENGLLWVEGVASLIDVANVNGPANLDGAGIRLLLANEHAKERRLAGSVGADDANNATRG